MIMLLMNNKTKSNKMKLNRYDLDDTPRNE